jgi:nicotinamide riboside kinase
VPQWVRELADRRRYDLTLLLDVDVPWVDDEQRFYGRPDERRAFFERYRAALELRGRAYRVIRGGWGERLEMACEAVRGLLAGGRAVC